MRPRLSQKDLVLILEGLAYLFRYHSRKKKEIEATQIYLLFKSLSEERLGRRSSWTWHGHELISKRGEYYQNMLERIKTMPKKIKEAESESKSPSV